jgi:hypothetical protein
MPELDLGAMELDQMELDLTVNEKSQYSSLSPHDSQLTNGGIASHHEIGGLIIPQSASSFIGGPVGGFDDISVRGDSGAGRPRAGRTTLNEDIGLEIDDDGNLIMNDAPSRPPPGQSTTNNRLDRGSVSSLVPTGALAAQRDAGAVGVAVRAVSLTILHSCRTNHVH